MTENTHLLLWDIHRSIMEIDRKFDRKLDLLAKEVRRLRLNPPKPESAPSLKIIEALLSPPMPKIIGATILLGAGFKLDQASEIISRLFG